jgi:rsbT co-antagonist protein RsbR
MLQRLIAVPGDADTRRRGRTVIIICLLIFVLNLARSPLALIGGVGLGQTLPATMLGIVGTLLSIGLARRGQVSVAAWVVILLGLLTISATPLIRGELIITVFFLSLPVFLAGLMLRPWQVWLATILALANLALLARVTTGTDWRGGELPLLLTLSALICAVGLVGFVAAHISTAVLADAAAARREAEASARSLEELNTSLEQRVSAQTAELRQALSEVEARAATQAALLAENEAQRAAIRELGVPVLPLSRDTLVMPLVGALDNARLGEVQTRALEAVEQTRARRLLLDITGIPVVDTQVAQGLMQVILATRLLGAEPILIGVRPEVAQTLVTLGINLADVRTEASLESALVRLERRV